MDERRSSPRVGMRQLVEVGYGREYFLQAAGVNLSESGLLCETAEAPEPGTRVFIMLEVRGDGPRNSDGSPQNIEIEGVVARTEESDNGYRVGIEFADIPDEDTKHALDTIIDHVQSKSA